MIFVLELRKCRSLLFKCSAKMIDPLRQMATFFVIVID